MKRFFQLSLALILLAIVGVYVLGALFFNDIYMPRTYINGKDFSLTAKSELEENYNAIYDNYTLTLKERDGEEVIPTAAFDYTDRLKEGAEVAQNPMYWPLYLLVDKQYKAPSVSTMDRAEFQTVLSGLTLLSTPRVAPQDAKVIYDGTAFTIQEEVLGNTIDTAKFTAAVEKAIQNRDDVLDLDAAEIYIAPQKTKDDPQLLALRDGKNSVLGFSITYDFADRQEVLQADRLANLYGIDDKGNFTVDKSLVENYVATTLKAYDTFKGTRDFSTTGLGVARVPGGIYGWLTDIGKTTDALVQALNDGKTVTMKPVYKLEGHSRAQNDVGNSYIEIDLGRQHMWLYREGQLVLDTPVVTGNPNEGNSTPTGTQKIWSRETDRILKGKTWESHVNYWLPFDWTGCGVHDSEWRDQYGNTIYRTNGSHGCVNTPPAVMAQLYDNTFYNMPVVIYDSTTQMI
ncbi:L,D-transpeptidase family protein [Peptoniphilus equinus]|uniref:L,D-transpeptidase family protein n=1 Tax=Peptoniphilus equinus TaxID=3016343 RepID=A0ABY7QS91_9FIRM|nr:L,D-transpeptidase family protein [Peptoniphilus equinus]WBW49655.1 L,D-transpeptidase family protein [Peptoniphilus equinus]